MSKIIFEKPALPISEQILTFIGFIGYYRLSGYAKLYRLKTKNSPETFIEETTFEQILSLYNFDRKLRLLVLGAKVFSTTAWILQSWLHSLTHIRNICTHHGRLYNRDFKITPVSINKYGPYFKNINSFYTQAIVIHLLLQTVAPRADTLRKDLVELFENHPEAESRSMGFPEQWDRDPLCQSKEFLIKG